MVKSIDSDNDPVAAEWKGKRRYGQGGVEYDRVRSLYRGSYHDVSGKRVRLPWCRSEQDAEEQLQAALELIAASADGLSPGGLTLRSWGKGFLDARELEGHRAQKDDRNRWKQYVLLAEFVDWPIASIGRRDVRRWMTTLNQKRTYGRSRPRSRQAKKHRPAPTSFLSWQTKTHALNLLRRAFERAIDDEKVPDDFANPCVGLKFKKPPTTEKPFNYFTREEIARLQRVAAPHIRPIIEFAIATGLRAGELRALRLEDVQLDVDAPYITVRYGKPPRKPTKSGEPREVPLLPMALRALKEWTVLRETWCKRNYKDLVFPAQYGGYRSAGKVLGRRHAEIWKELLATAGIRRHLVWHDLRHTCATALLGGYFGQKWRLEEIQQLLGHSDIETTQRYAHALKQTLHEVARATKGDLGNDE